MAKNEDVPHLPLEDMDEATRNEVIKTRRMIKIVGFVSIGLIALMMILTFIAVALAYGD